MLTSANGSSTQCQIFVHMFIMRTIITPQNRSQRFQPRLQKVEVDVNSNTHTHTRGRSEQVLTGEENKTSIRLCVVYLSLE